MGCTFLWAGLRPLTTREQIEEFSSVWAPEKNAFSNAQQSAIDDVTRDLNTLRSSVRARWAQGDLPVYAGDTEAALQNPNYPWRQLDAGWGNIAVKNSAGTYSTHILSPALQSAVAAFDHAAHYKSLADLPELVSPTVLRATIRSVLATPERLSTFAAYCALRGGTHLHAQLGHAFNVVAARRLQKSVAGNMPGNSPVLAWLALNTGLGDMTPDERRTLRTLAQQHVRVPRNLSI